MSSLIESVVTFLIAYVMPILVVTVICKTLCAATPPERSVYHTMNSIPNSCEQQIEDSRDVAEELEASKRKLADANAEIFKLHQRLIEVGLEQK